MNDLEIKMLRKEVDELKKWRMLLERSSTIPREIDQSFKQRFFNFLIGLSGVVVGNGTLTPTSQTPVSTGNKIYWVSDTNGGAVNRKLTFTNGILTKET